MTPQEVALLLTAAASVDDRIDPDEARVAAWSAMLLPDMPFVDAREFLVAHYRDRRDIVMPADLNTRWRSRRRELAERAQAEQRQLDNGDAVPMPDHVREMLRNFGKGSVTNHA